MMLISFLIKRTYRSNANTIQWNKTIRNHQINGNHQQALKLFQLGIDKKTFQPNSITYLTILDVCKELKSLPTLRTIHQLIDSSKNLKDTDDDIYNNSRIRSLLMDVYIKCQDLDGAYRVFQSMKERNVIDYGALITGFNNQEYYEKTLQFAREIPSSIKYSSPILCTLILQACSALNQYDDGLKIHQSGKPFLLNDKIFRNELMNFYLKFHQEKQALDIFNKYPNQQTIIDYSLLMKYYIRQYQPQKTIDLYHRLRTHSHIQMDHIIYVLVLQAIANGCCLHTSQQIRELPMNIDVNNALINMYGKLGDLNQAEKVFYSMSKHNIVSYNILLNLYGLYRQPDKALKSYNQMCQQGHRPDDKTSVLLLHTLSQTPTKINDVKRIFSNIEENKRGPMLRAAMIAALTRAELFDEVKEFLKQFPKENLLFYAIKANINEITNQQFHYPITITNEQRILYDLLMSNIYSYGGFHDRSAIIDEMVSKNKNLENLLSYSWFENSNGKIEYFKSSNFFLSSTSCEHTEKLALDHAMAERRDSSLPILIGKNHRICIECHEYFKKLSFSSSVKKIILRDSTGFHLFSSGICSCEVSS